MSPQRIQRKKTATCGTRAGLYRHYRLREIACDPCLKADADYHRARYAIKRGAA